MARVLSGLKLHLAINERRAESAEPSESARPRDAHGGSVDVGSRGEALSRLRSYIVEEPRAD